jgi:hypothetical protein
MFQLASLKRWHLPTILHRDQTQKNIVIITSYSLRYLDINFAIKYSNVVTVSLLQNYYLIYIPFMDVIIPCDDFLDLLYLLSLIICKTDFLDFVHRLYLNKITTFRKLDLHLSSGKKR